MQGREDIQIQEEFNIQKVLWFKLGAEDYGIKVDYVLTVIDTAPGIPVPNTPKFVKEVVNLRGTLIPIMNLKELFPISKEESGEEMMVILDDVDGMRVGIMVDQVNDVLDIDMGELLPAPPSLSAFGAECIYGIHKFKEKILVILDIARVVGIAREMMTKFS
ncbi:MAG: chemotaxis protein CheW [bacterium]